MEKCRGVLAHVEVLDQNATYVCSHSHVFVVEMVSDFIAFRSFHAFCALFLCHLQLKIIPPPHFFTCQFCCTLLVFSVPLGATA